NVGPGNRLSTHNGSRFLRWRGACNEWRVRRHDFVSPLGRCGRMFRTLFRGWIVVLFAGMGVPVVHAQRAGTTLRDSVGDAAAALLNDGRTNEARIALMRALRAGTDPAQKATYRLELGDTFLFDGQYGEAARAYN